jgi:hypothetical protein
MELSTGSTVMEGTLAEAARLRQRSATAACASVDLKD